MTKDARPMLVEEIMELQEEVRKKEKLLKKLKGLLKDIITKEGPYHSEELGVVAYIEPRYRHDYDLEELQKEYPEIAEVVMRTDVDRSSMGQILEGGLVTGSELDQKGIRTQTMIARALLFKPLVKQSYFSRQEEIRKELG